MRVLLVEDDEGIISFLEKGLREAKYALDGFSTLADYAQGRPFSFVQQQGNGHVVSWKR